VCHCGDAAAQPCIAALIADYLETLRWSVITDGADGGPGDADEIARCRRYVRDTMRTFGSVAELEKGLGIGLLRR
jgi:hypothetical protein